MAVLAEPCEGVVDGSMLAACRTGDREAFRLLYDRCQPRVFSIALRFLHGNRAAAEDVTQEVFVRLFDRIGQFREEADFRTWLYRLVANACVDEMRKNRRLVSLDPADGRHAKQDSVRVEDEVLVREEAQCVRQAIDALSPKLRLPILLRYFGGLSYEEVAAALGCSSGTVASRLNRGHRALAEKLAHLSGRNDGD